MASEGTQLLGPTAQSYSGQLDSTRFELLQPQAKIEIGFEQLRFGVPDNEDPQMEKVIIHNMTGCMPAARMTAIMGPSGCGKTTLMDMIANVKTMPYEGSIYVNGEARRSYGVEDLEMGYAFNRAMGYVGQHDHANGFCTVHETLMFHALLRPPALSEKARDCVERWQSSGMDTGMGQDSDFLSTRTAVSYTHLRAHETPEHLVCRLLLEKKKKKNSTNNM
eukprot:TRINITY_DN36593_c0_g1_i2.p1 TRINITY_DN36593_c0_g1~~TRINITY_DN36593_c0_g1_i2.p1  ORF type:complete len:221 (-),score=50.36 TRINITY_DN36593_c0_g1_i2:61-723(-)